MTDPLADVYISDEDDYSSSSSSFDSDGDTDDSVHRRDGNGGGSVGGSRRGDRDENDDDVSQRSGSSRDLETMMKMMLDNPMIKALHERRSITLPSGVVGGDKETKSDDAELLPPEVAAKTEAMAAMIETAMSSLSLTGPIMSNDDDDNDDDDDTKNERTGEETISSQSTSLDTGKTPVAADPAVSARPPTRNNADDIQPTTVPAPVASASKTPIMTMDMSGQAHGTTTTSRALSVGTKTVPTSEVPLSTSTTTMTPKEIDLKQKPSDGVTSSSETGTPANRTIHDTNNNVPDTMQSTHAADQPDGIDARTQRDIQPASQTSTTSAAFTTTTTAAAATAAAVDNAPAIAVTTMMASANGANEQPETKTLPETRPEADPHARQEAQLDTFDISPTGKPRSGNRNSRKSRHMSSASVKSGRRRHGKSRRRGKQGSSSASVSSFVSASTMENEQQPHSLSRINDMVIRTPANMFERSADSVPTQLQLPIESAPPVAAKDDDVDDTLDVHSNGLMYERQADYTKLVNAYRNRHLRHLVMVVGQRGNGKTTLLKALQTRVERDNGFFVMGRYDPIDFPQPFAPLIETSKLYLQRLLEKGQERSLTRVRRMLSRSMDQSEMQSLATVIPILTEVMQLSNDDSKPISSSASSSGTASTTNSSSVFSAVSNSRTNLVSNGSCYDSNISSSSINKGNGHLADAAPSLPGHGKKLGKSRSSFLVTYCNFMRAISHPSHPIVLVLDDCQAADPGSLEVLKILVADQKIQGLLCVVGFQPVGVRHPFSMFLRNLESAGVKFVPILPSAIPAPAILEWMQNKDAFDLQDYPNLEQWSEHIEKGTKGNALSIKLCLLLLEQHKDIFMPQSMYDDAGDDIIDTENNTEGESMKNGGRTFTITSTPLKVGGEVHQLFGLLFMMLSQSCQKLLQMASCMGMKIHEQRLKRLYNEFSSSNDQVFLKTLQEAKEAGIIQKLDSTRNRAITKTDDTETTRYEFANASYKDCIYRSMSKDDQAKYHAAVGDIYRENIQTVGIYRALAHLRQSRSQLSSRGKEAFARLCLQAGLDASGWTEFISAIDYLDLGIELLEPKQKWKQQYELSLALYSASADVYKSSGNFQKMDQRLVEILDNARSASDKLSAYSIQMRSLSGRTMHEEAIALGLRVLPNLGEQLLPTNNRRGANATEMEVKEVQKVLDQLDMDALLIDLKRMSDKRKAGAMSILNLLLSSCMMTQGEMVPLIASRMVMLSVRDGLTDVSAVGFVTLGCQLCAMGDIEKGVWCGEVALQILERTEGNAWKGRVMAIHWGILSRYSRTWRQCQEPLKIAYRLCMESGDNEFALISPVLSVFNMLAAGGSLSNVAAAMKSVYQLLHKRDQFILMRIIKPFFQTVLNLIGATTETNPLILSGSIMNEEEEFKFAKQHSSRKILFSLYLCQAEMAFLLHKFKRAQAALDKAKELSGSDVIFSSLSIKVDFLDAMISAAMAWHAHHEAKEGRDSGKRKKYYMSKVQERLGKLEMMAQYAPENLQQKVYIIQAELRAMVGLIDESMMLYKRAMDHAEANGNMCDRTLACERAGLALRSCEREDDALDYLEDCCAYYREWGAIVKVNHVKGNVIPQAIFDWDE